MRSYMLVEKILCLSYTLPLKEGISRYGNLRTMSRDKWATSKSTQLSTNDFWGPLTNWQLEPSPRPHTHTLTPSSINKQNRWKKLHVDLCTDLTARGQNFLTHWKARIWLLWLSKKNPDISAKTMQELATNPLPPSFTVCDVISLITGIQLRKLPY